MGGGGRYSFPLLLRTYKENLNTHVTSRRTLGEIDDSKQDVTINLYRRVVYLDVDQIPSILVCFVCGQIMAREGER